MGALVCAPLTSLALEMPEMVLNPLNIRPVLSDAESAKAGAAIREVDCGNSSGITSELRLMDAVNVALCNNPQIRAQKAILDAQAAAVGEAKSAYWPTVNLAWTKVKTRTQYPDQPDFGTSSTGGAARYALSWRVMDFGGRSARTKAAEHSLDAALFDLETTVQKAMSAVASAYADALTAQAAQLAMQEALSLAERTLKSTVLREAHGISGLNDTLQAKTALAKVQLNLQRAVGDLHKAHAALVYVMGLPAGTPLSFVEETDWSILPLDAVSDWLDKTRQSHPAIQSAKAQWLSEQEKVVMATSEGLPTLDLALNRYRNSSMSQALIGNNSISNDMILTLNVPVFEGFGRVYKIRGAQAQVAQALARMQDTENQVLAEVAKAHADAVASALSLKAASALLEAARQAQESSMRRYDKGAADILEVLSVQTALTDAQKENIRSRVEWRSAYLRLLASAGLSPK